MRSQDGPARVVTPAPPASSTGSPTWWMLGAIVALGTLLRFGGIGDKSLWVDETFSIWVGVQPLDAVGRTSAGLDLHPPLYYMLLHLWLAFGESEAAVRSLSALLGVLTIPIAYLIGRFVGGTTLGLLAASLLAISPLHIAYAQQARMYTMLTFFAAAATLCLLHVLQPAPAPARATHRTAVRGPNRWWIGFVLSTVLTMLSHNTAVLFPAAVVLFAAAAALLVAREPAGPAQRPVPGPGPFRGLPGIATGLAAALVLWLPWLPTFLAQTRRVDADFWLPPPTLDAVLRHWADLANAFGPDGRYLLPVVVVVVGLAVLGAWRLRGTPTVPLLLLVLLLAPAAAELLVSLRRPIFYTQTLVWTAVPLCVLLAAGLLGLRWRSLTVAATGLVVALNSVALVEYHRYGGQEDWRAAASYVAPLLQPGDLVLFNAGWTEIPFTYYYRRQGGPEIMAHGLPVDLFARGIIEPKMTRADLARLDGLVAGRPTVWLVYSHDWYTDPEGLVAEHLAAAYGPADVEQFAGIRVLRYGDAPS
jgi:mannosyltransferase